MEKINFSHYFRLHTRQKYFIWNNLDPIYLENIDLEEENLGDIVWDFDSLADEVTNFSELHINIFKDFSAKFHSFIKDKFSDKKICLVYKVKINEKISQTLNFYKSGQCDIIFNPAFGYEQASANPSVFFVFDKKISILKLSTSTKVKDYLRANWDFWITTYALREISGDFNPVEKFSYFLLDTVESPIKNKTEFCETFWLSMNKGVKTPSKADREGVNAFLAKKIAKQYGFTLAEYSDSNFLEQNKIIKNLFGNKIEKISNTKTKKITKMVPIKTAIKEIIEAKKIKEFSPPIDIDNGDFEKNPDFNSLISIFYPKLAGISGILLKAKNALSLIKNEEELFVLEKNSYWFNFFQKNNFILINEIEKLNEFLNNFKNNKIVWYDFEAFSLPFPPIDYVQPFQQIVSQVSIIVTENGKILPQDFSETNLIFDPKNYTWKNFCEIIDKIYLENADFYVVFNKSYELTRLKEMVEIIFKNYLKEMPHHLAVEKIQKYQLKIDKIIEKTLDLKDPFAKYWIVVSDLKGFYSIKKIENFINKYEYKLEHLIVPYKQLAVKNGLEAMVHSIDRYFDFIGDNEWEKTKKNLQLYCQNDVIAMIMVYDFLNFVRENLNKKENISLIETQKVTLF
ncbi:Domain of uncharacterised function(DUF2779) [Mesomycoplasma dispar]|uniref:Domain of uncharacterized function(DUF2779) n=1 Tax=Mesomycoplasma dispar TaxID=86660 RepID=A0AAJ5NLT2_9BACT|nr:DUF2779 domain-containing protein [Mesomycoplasma dispar]AJR12100.1 hypothetical protein MDIS_01295 [Mesomycoplasma dispar]VEU61466.1 Domain of uncharacterised function(DUF2779) [Mesomycoplasma dispar]